MNMFEEIKDAVSTREAASFYGLSVQRGGMVCCPFHNDKHPSMKVDNRYHCFACGADGDVIDFVSNYFGLSIIDSVKKLNEDFFLGIEFGYDNGKSYRSPEKMRTYKEQLVKREVLRAFDVIRRDAISILSNYHRLLWEWKKEYEPKSTNEKDAAWHPFFVEALNKLDFVNEVLDELTFGDRTTQIEILDIYGEEIKRIGDRIKCFE